MFPGCKKVTNTCHMLCNSTGMGIHKGWLCVTCVTISRNTVLYLCNIKSNTVIFWNSINWQCARIRRRWWNEVSTQISYLDYCDFRRSPNTNMETENCEDVQVVRSWFSPWNLQMLGDRPICKALVGWRIIWSAPFRTLVHLFGGDKRNRCKS